MSGHFRSSYREFEGASLSRTMAAAEQECSFPLMAVYCQI